MSLDSLRCEPFVSELLRQSLSRRGQRLEAPFEELIPAALFFGDLSGFTDVAERLANDLSRGAEGTQRILNRHFCRALEVIDRWGGCLLHFAGDATIAVWPAAEGGLAEATALATGCALELQQRIQGDQLADASAMPHRVVIGAGTLWLAHVGGVEDHWHFVVAGEPWDQIRTADELAKPGWVVVSAQAWSELETRAVAEPLSLGCQRVTHCSATAPATPPHGGAASAIAAGAERYVPHSLRAHLSAGQRDWLAEYRWATVSYLTLDGIEPGQPGALERLHTATRATQEIVGAYDGHILQVLVDDKGFVVLTTWGIALAAHEDDAERALRAAQALLKAMTGLGLTIRIGLKSGRVFAGLLGHEQHMEYAIIGDPVNVASRIAKVATDTLLCDRATRDAAQQRFVFEFAQAVRFKGKSEATELYRILSERPHRESARPQPMHAPVLVNRETLRATLWKRLERALPGAGLFVHLLGEPGVGKSKIVELLALEAPNRGWTVACGGGDSLRRAEAYFPLLALLPVLLGIDDLLDAQRVCAALSALRVAAELHPLLNPMLPQPLPETPRTANLDSAGRADLTRDLFVELVTQADRRARLLIVLDDAHWFDSASWSLLLTLLRRVPRLGLVLLSRPLQASALAPDARRVLELPTREVLELEPFSFTASRTLIATRLAVESISDDLAQRIFERAEGNPLFTEELLLSLQNQAAIRRGEHSASLALESLHAPRVVLPEAIDGVVASRIADLDAAQQLTIKVASVLGRSFRLSTLAALRPIPLSEEALAQQLERMCSAQLLERVLGPDVDAYRFHHSIIQNVVHELLVSEQQQQLHRAAAELLEREGSTRREREWARLAHHWGLAQNDRKAIDYLELAAEQARRDHAMLEVSVFLHEAFERAERCPDALPWSRRAHWDQLAGEAEAELGRVTQAEQHLRRAVTYLDKPQPVTDLALSAALARECARHALLRAGVRGPAPAHPERASSAARAYSGLAAIYYNNHELVRMLYVTLTGANLALRIGGDSPILARMLANLSIVATVVPGLDPDYYAQGALAMAERLTDPVALQEVLMVVANYEMGAARFSAAITHCERAAEIARVTGELRNWEIAIGTLANLFRLRGEPARADKLDRSVLQSGIDRSVTQTQVWGFFGRACALTLLNRFEELSVLLVDFEALLSDPEVVSQVSASNLVAQLLTAALLHLHEGREAPARAAVEKSVALLDSLLHLQAYMTCTLSYLRWAIMACWRRDPGSPQLQRWCALADRFALRCARQFPCAAAQAALGRGDRQLRRGRMRRAARAYRVALREATELDNPFDQACAHHSLSQCQALSPRERAEHAAHCRRLLDGLGLEQPVVWTV